MADLVPVPVVLFVRVVAVHLVCDLCADEAHLMPPPGAGTESLEEFVTEPGGAWMTSHRWPRIAYVVMDVDGEQVIMDHHDVT